MPELHIDVHTKVFHRMIGLSLALEAADLKLF